LCLGVEFPVEVLAEEHLSHLRQHLLGQHVETRLKRVADLDAVVAYR
jgi:hypothetical protein